MLDSLYFCVIIVDMKVLKFGGTSVGSVRSMTAVRDIVANLGEDAVIVVSALGGLTDKLILAARLASEGNPAYLDELEIIKSRHCEMIREMLSEEEKAEVAPTVAGLHESLSEKLQGIFLIRSLPQQVLDEVVSYGERISSVIAAKAVGAVHIDSLSVVKTEKWFNRNIAAMDVTPALIKNAVEGAERFPVLMGGFISTDRETGEITNLGRGGSDYTAAIVAATLDADILEIWTDVDGFMTADPRIIKDAAVIPEMSFVESMELCSFGAKVIYPPTIYPVFHKNIPIRILNTFNPSAPGTLITDKPFSGSKEKKMPLTGISSLPNTSLFEMNGKGVDNIAEINSRIFNALAKRGIRVVLVSQSYDEASVKFVIMDDDASDASAILDEEFGPELSSGTIVAPEIMKGLATIAIVGEDLPVQKGLDSRILHTLRREGIEVLASSCASSATTVSIVVASGCRDKAMRLLHESFFPVS